MGDGVNVGMDVNAGATVNVGVTVAVTGAEGGVILGFSKLDPLHEIVRKIAARKSIENFSSF
ncbi:MAG: hypothetical protein HY863_13020 [Chloroflexi bacterium]|nr:hypothetical protein [Chloroflexota bacterium]